MTDLSQAVIECAHCYRLAFPDLDVPMCVFYARAVCPVGVLFGDWVAQVFAALKDMDEVSV